jgi:hypothetical protein
MDFGGPIGQLAKRNLLLVFFSSNGIITMFL